MKRTTRAKKVPKVDAETAEIVSIQLDVSTGSVRRGSDVVALRAKTLAVLQHLMERAGSIVGREELREKVWGKRHGNVDGPKQCVREIRAALHDVTKPPRFIETVGRRGYRFIGDLEVVGAEKNQDSPGLIPSATVRPTCVGREQELDGLANWLARARSRRPGHLLPGGRAWSWKNHARRTRDGTGLKGPFADRARADLRRISR